MFYGSDDEYVTSDIYTIHVDGSGLVNLTSDLGGVHLYPSWLWDGSKIAFQSSHEGEPEVFVMNADGSHPVNLTQYSAASDHAPDWSADGNHIVFYSKRDTANREIYVMDADGANVTRLTTNTDYNQFPS